MRFINLGLAILFVAQSFAADAVPLADRFERGRTYYYDTFDPNKRPWEAGQDLNIEEVFKNYQYYEIVLNQDGKALTVNRYIRGVKTGSGTYMELPDGSLRIK